MERPREFPEGQGPNDLSLPCMFWCTHLVVSFMKEMEQNPMFGNQQSKSQPISRSIKNAASGVCIFSARLFFAQVGHLSSPNAGLWLGGATMDPEKSRKLDLVLRRLHSFGAPKDRVPFRGAH